MLSLRNSYVQPGWLFPPCTRCPSFTRVCCFSSLLVDVLRWFSASCCFSVLGHPSLLVPLANPLVVKVRHPRATHVQKQTRKGAKVYDIRHVVFPLEWCPSHAGLITISTSRGHSQNGPNSSSGTCRTSIVSCFSPVSVEPPLESTVWSRSDH